MRETADEAVVAEVELMEELHALEGFRDVAAKAVGVEVEEGEVGEETKLRWEVAGDVSVVEVDAGDNPLRRIGGRRSTEHSQIRADVGTVPVGGEIEWVGEDGGFPCLEGNVGLTETWVLKLKSLNIIIHNIVHVIVIIVIVISGSYRCRADLNNDKVEDNEDGQQFESASTTTTR